MNDLIVYPMTFYVLYTFAFAIANFVTRVAAIKNKSVSFGYFKDFQGTAQLPNKMVIMGRHYDNQFQLPMLFLMTCLALLQFNVVDATFIVLLWAFIAFRVMHTLIHLGSNNIRQRVIAFALGWLVLVVIWLRLLFLTN